MGIDYTSLVLYIGTGLLVIAAVYIYGYRRTKPSVFQIIGVILFCYITAISIPLFIKGIDYGFRGESFLGVLDASEIRIILAIASVVVFLFLGYLFYQFMEFIAQRHQNE